MKVSLFLVGLALFELNTYVHGSCDINRGDELTCTDFNDDFLAYSNEYENLTYVRLNGDFSEIGFDSSYIKLSRVELNSKSLVNFNMNNLNNLTALKHLHISSYSDKTVDLNFNGKRNDFKHLEVLELRGVKNILGSFTSFVNLTYIKLYRYEKDFFDFSLLPNSLVDFRIDSGRETTLVNEINLKRLSHLTLLNLKNSQTTLNASFIPSSLHYLYIKSVTDQQSLVETNITFLQMYKSETALEFIPMNLQDLRLWESELNVTCEQLQQSKISFWYIRTSKRSLDMKCLPNVTSTIYYIFNTQPHFDLSYLPSKVKHLELLNNKIQSINLKPLISHRHIKQIGLTGNPINCTCETFRDFIQIVSNQSVEKLWLDCAHDSLLSRYPLRYGGFGSNAATRQIKLQEILDHNRHQRDCAVEHTEVTTGSVVPVNLSSGSRRLTSTSTSIVSAIVASFLIFFVVAS